MTDYIKEASVIIADLSVDDGGEDDFILIIENLKVYFELRKRGIQHAGFVRAVDGVDLKLKCGDTIDNVVE